MTRWKLAAAIALGLFVTGPSPAADGIQRYGVIGHVHAKPGQREALLSVLLDDVKLAPGNLSWVVALDPRDPDSFWLTEIWESKRHHDDNFKSPDFQAVVTRIKPLLDRMEPRYETVPLGGNGLPK